MLLNHTPAGLSHTFDEHNLIATTGLIPVMSLAQRCGLARLANEWITVANTGGHKGANPGAKISSLIAGMVAGADSIDDLDLLRHGGMPSVFERVYAPSTLGSFLREFTHGHVKQLAAVASRFLTNLGHQVPLLPVRTTSDPRDGMVTVDIDDTILEVYSPNKQGAGIGYTKTRGLNALLVTASTNTSAPVIIGQQLRKGAANSVRGADKLLADSLATLGRVPGGQGGPVVVRGDSAYYATKIAKTVLDSGADLSVTVKMNTAVKTAIAAINVDAWTGIKYPKAIWDEDSGQWISEAQIAEIGFTAFSSKPSKDQVPGRLIVRRIPEKNPKKLAAAQGELFTTYRYHGFFTTIPATVLDAVKADQMHRQHAVIELINAELKDGPLAHMPSGRFQANAAWLVTAVMAHNLLRTTATLIGGTMARARSNSLRPKIITIPARIAHRARRLILHLPAHWKWAPHFGRLWNTALSPPTAVTT